MADRATFCPDCGYSLKGNASGQCPECGATFDLQALRHNNVSGRQVSSGFLWT